MKKVVVFAVAALLVPSAALAKGQASAKSAGSPTVMYLLKGTLVNYTAASGSSDGSVTIMVNRANRHGWALKTETLTFTVTSSTKVRLKNGTFTANDRGIVKVRAQKNFASDTDLQAYFAGPPPLDAFQVIDQGVAGKSGSSHGKSGSSHGKSGNSHGKSGSHAPKVMYVLKGTLTAYTPASGGSDGSVTIMVNRANRHGWSLKTETLTFTVTSNTKITGSFTANDRGIVKVRAQKNFPSDSDLQTYFQGSPNAFQVIDQGASS